MLTYGRVMPFLELFARIDAVDRDTVMETAKDFIIDKVKLGIFLVIIWSASLLLLSQQAIRKIHALT
jgi:hypothetical protein